MAPIPYPNIAMAPMGVPAAYTILFVCAPAHNLSTMIPLTNGDNAGVAMGVASGTVMGPSRHLTGAFTVLLGRDARHAADEHDAAEQHQLPRRAHRPEPDQGPASGAVSGEREHP